MTCKYSTAALLLDGIMALHASQTQTLPFNRSNWNGSGELATPDQETETPPILATETEAGSPNHDPTDPASDPESPDYFPLIIEVQPILIVGCTTSGAAKKTDTNPIC